LNRSGLVRRGLQWQNLISQGELDKKDLPLD
jgi:hypothetical protein